MGDHDPEPWEWRAYRRATGLAVPAAWRRTRRARAGYALLGAALLAAAAAALVHFGLRAGSWFLVGAAAWAFVRATEGLRRPSAEDLVACPGCGPHAALLMDPDGRVVVACPTCNLARPFGPDAWAPLPPADAPADAASRRRDATGDPY